MIKRSLIGLFQPKLSYDVIGTTVPDVKTVRPRGAVQMLVERTGAMDKVLLLQNGDKVKTGARLVLNKNDDQYAISPVTGTIRSIDPYTGDFGKTYTAITIELENQDEADPGFAEKADAPGLDGVATFLKTMPGTFPAALLAPGSEIHTIVVAGMDEDLLVNTRQYVVKTQTAAIKNGIERLKDLTGIENIVITVPETLAQDGMATGARVQTVTTDYPSALPKAVVQKIAGKPVPAGQSCEAFGFALISAEAVAALGNAFESKQVPTRKLLTVTDKYGRKTMVSALIGTSIKDILDSLDITVNDGDRIVAGGPMTGVSVYTETQPIKPDTDALMIQDRKDIPLVSDAYCINCGECVRICPARIPVNMLVRYLEAGQYEEAIDTCDLDACIECGLCSFVCTAQIPIFQFIRLANYELERIHTAEAENV